MSEKYTPNPILFREENILDEVLSGIQRINKHIKIGDRVTGFESVWEGKVVPMYLVHDAEVRLDYVVPHVKRPSVELGKSETVKLYFNDPHCFDQFKKLRGYLHPVCAIMPHAHWLRTKMPGDVLNLHDEAANASPYTLTQEDFDKHSYVTFRYILSDK